MLQILFIQYFWQKLWNFGNNLTDTWINATIQKLTGNSKLKWHSQQLSRTAFFLKHVGFHYVCNAWCLTVSIQNGMQSLSCMKFVAAGSVTLDSGLCGFVGTHKYLACLQGLCRFNLEGQAVETCVTQELHREPSFCMESQRAFLFPKGDWLHGVPRSDWHTVLGQGHLYHFTVSFITEKQTT